ncbi:hypothetical protein COCVIDRAFT_108591 [Bipolaris victoriae FI3]|uniref:Carbohydrate-binding module family 19 domain-containing protein n=2 Tax=Bipolaris TaxID=33194 RepID=W6YFV6_COCC2|nr:uncharacterized protein COCCADRAFT_87981 [Bipolaris zeicola 26-R-13]XP_014553082.1 hypothetical protein COCVIDRAFT_108591 [Bipolaris victoriae FI3]EUC36565.1 hypothetical protein COCCADRAFT_87981 [Bipolaris zeicola 26-R-13]
MRSTTLITTVLSLLTATSFALPAEQAEGLTARAKCSTRADCSGGKVCMVVGCHGQIVGSTCETASYCSSFSAPTCGATCK